MLSKAEEWIPLPQLQSHLCSGILQRSPNPQRAWALASLKGRHYA